MTVRMTVLLEDEVDASFTSFCKDKGFKKSTLAARLIREYLAREAGQSKRNTRKMRGTSADHNRV